MMMTQMMMSAARSCDEAMKLDAHEAARSMHDDTSRMYVHRVGCVSQYYGSAAAWIWRSQVPALPAAAADGRGGEAGAQEWGRVL